MKKILTIGLLSASLLAIAGLLVWRDANDRTSALAAAAISDQLTDSSQIDQIISQSTALSSDQLAEIPGFLDIIDQDLGTAAVDAAEFYLLPQTFVDTFQFGHLPGPAAWRNQFLVLKPSGIVYYAGWPVAMAKSFSQTYTCTIRPLDKVLANPFIGWAPAAKNLPSVRLAVQMAYAGLSWQDLEPEKGVYDFASIESNNQFAYCREHGIRLVLRVILDYPSQEKTMQLPQWLYDEMGGAGQFYFENGKGGFSPDYSNPVLIEAHGRLLAALGARYDQDPLVAFIEVGSIGHYGEWHVSASAGQMPGEATLQQYIRQYQEAFPDKVLMFRRPYQIVQAMQAGLYNDMFGDENQTGHWLDWIQNGGEQGPLTISANPDFWQKGPSGGEFANGDPYFYLSDQQYPETLRQALASHTSLLGPCAPTKPVGQPVDQNAADLLGRIGYRFKILSTRLPRVVQSGESFVVQIKLDNEGNSPMYYSWPVQLTVFDGSGESVARSSIQTDTSDWLPGMINLEAAVNLSAALAPGIYTLGLAIIDPDTSQPGIDFPNEGLLPDGSFACGRVMVRSRQ